MSTVPVRFVVREVALYERPVELRLPFRFGVITLTACPQAFARVVIEIASGAPSSRAQGGSAELMVPKWFDKRAQLSQAQNIDQLRFAAHAAGTVLHSALEPATAFDFSIRMTDAVRARANQYDIPPLASGFGPALLERALIDALCRALGCSFFEAARKNLLGVDRRAVAETNINAGGIERFCMTLQARERIGARHTVGLLDPISDAEATSAPNDGLPVSLAGAIRRYGHRAFKLKVAGDLAADLARLRAIARVLDELPEHWLASLDGNEQFEDVEPVVELLAKMREDAALARLYERIAYIEQPLARARALDVSVAPIDRHKPVIIDESDADETSFVTARARGYRGVSSKTCKG
ncbi:MAG TPA: hypothetical protein VFR86_29485, partial [Burkholderiaceae bacterium]|nr:hypothetical protein [Burkholderiaceae bacterium]